MGACPVGSPPRAVRFGAALLSGAQADAAPSTSAAVTPTCTYNRVCVWSQPFFQGFKNSQAPADPGNCQNLPITAHSVWNNTPYTQRLHATWLCTGGSGLIAPFQQVTDLGTGRRGLGAY
ncbi:hypothetical protein Airi02_075850 [Actinoallomurus iriomotensis]|uniref:Peptidase inhibitor family I36 n=1 Tax=Actinoallomurus iriomotensis TaxID=478107 RepID=A0A9W6S9M7_9ACTN|nr:hypothetical protein Airi02_075850 [Actinoallomurus iriomotensis]